MMMFAFMCMMFWDSTQDSVLKLIYSHLSNRRRNLAAMHLHDPLSGRICVTITQRKTKQNMFSPKSG